MLSTHSFSLEEEDLCFGSVELLYLCFGSVRRLVESPVESLLVGVVALDVNATLFVVVLAVSVRLGSIFLYGLCLVKPF